jgi:hypothetical protein
VDDLKERFAEADRMIGRNHWHDIATRAVSPEVTPRPLERPLAPRRRAVAAVVASAVFVASSVFAWNLSHPEIVPEPPSPADPPVDLAAGLAPGWTELPSPPKMRDRAATAWTGSELIVWGGYVYEVGFGEGPLSHEGSIFDAASRRWEPMAAAPLSARSSAASAWTGEEFLVWGGRSRETCCRPSDTELFLNDGAAYDPSARTWRRLPEAPIEARAPLSVWTGEELIVWGNTDRTLRYRDGAAYKPSTNSWRRIVDGPIDLTDAVAVWSGGEMYVFGAALHDGGFPETETAIGAAYDPATDSWRRLPPSLDSNPNANTAVWADERLIALDYDSDAETYEPSTGRWRTLDPMPLDDGEDVPSAAYIEGWVLARFFRGVAGFSTDTERWVDLSDDLAEEAPGTLIFGPPIAAGNAFLAFAIGPGERSRLLAYRPPVGNEAKATLFVPAVSQDGDFVRMPVVFPDGSEATLVYPAKLQLAELGVQPDVSYRRTGDPEKWFPIVFVHGRDAPISSFVDRSGPIRLVNHSSGGVEVWKFNQRWIRRFEQQGMDHPAAHWIRFRLPSWTVLVAIGREQQWIDVLADLTVRETSAGFPVVEPSGSIALNEGHSDAGGPQLAFGDGIADPGIFTNGDTIVLFPYPCTPGTELGPPGYGSSCLAGGDVFANVSGEQAFVNDVVEGLRIETFAAW